MKCYRCATNEATHVVFFVVPFKGADIERQPPLEPAMPVGFCETCAHVVGPEVIKSDEFRRNASFVASLMGRGELDFDNTVCDAVTIADPRAIQVLENFD